MRARVFMVVCLRCVAALVPAFRVMVRSGNCLENRFNRMIPGSESIPRRIRFLIRREDVLLDDCTFGEATAAARAPLFQEMGVLMACSRGAARTIAPGRHPPVDNLALPIAGGMPMPIASSAPSGSRMIEEMRFVAPSWPTARKSP
jgi:hypothetical protein